MKKILLIAMLGLCLPGSVLALPNGKVVGVVAGTAAGLIVANNVRGVNPWVAAPVGALLGGYIGSRYEQRSRYDDYRDNRGYDHSDRYRHHNAHHSGYRGDDDRYPYPGRRTTVVYVEKPAPKKTAVTPTPADPQPGVDLIKVSILNANGIRTDVPILRVKGKFVGPQGESYETLPTAAQLAPRYGL
jgi:hypothetical protein